MTFLCRDLCVASIFYDVLVLLFCVRFGFRRYGIDEMSSRQYTHGFDWNVLASVTTFMAAFVVYLSLLFISFLSVRVSPPYPVSFQVINACGHIFTDIISLVGFQFHANCGSLVLVSCLFDAFQFNSMVHGLTFSFLCESLLG